MSESGEKPETRGQHAEGLHSKHAAVNTILASNAAERKLLWRQDKRIIPLSAGIYFLCYLDRSNIGNAKILNNSSHDDMQTQNGMTNYQFNVALMIFLIGYFLFEVPSNIMLKKLRPSRWLAIIMFIWGAITIGLGGTKTYAEVTVVRFLLGAAEAGLFPGLVYYLTFWYKSDERSCDAGGGAFGGAIAYGIGHMNGAAGHAAWRWLFWIEGIPSCLSAVAVFFFLPDFPERANWLSEAEKDLAVQRLYLEGSKGEGKGVSWEDAKATITDWRLYGHYAIYFAVSLPFSSLSLFVPSITQGLGYKDLEAQLMSVPPYAEFAGSICFTDSRLLVCRPLQQPWISLRRCCFRRRHRVPRISCPPPDNYGGRYATLVIGSAGAFACVPPMLGWLSSNIWTTASTGLAIAINGYPTGHGVNCAMLFVVTIGAIGLSIFYQRKNKRIQSSMVEGDEVRLYKL
ncbi:MFS transporter [Apiospora kogelbergensis]|uniref:MFS transporter n=1 Tax=Apiospora kogelbergensis TaxID=1337665 RepID=UPI0031315DFB